MKKLFAKLKAFLVGDSSKAAHLKRIQDERYKDKKSLLSFSIRETSRTQR